ncbi:MAG TPA: hypothetical protein VKQ52_07495, partial [Puia sp.]|nr:hypothetical protein [Puia sp.]
MNAKDLRPLFVCWLLVVGMRVAAQPPAADHPGKIQNNWIVFIFEQDGKGLTTAYPRYFLLYTDGTVHQFAPGEQPQPFEGIDQVISLASSDKHVVALRRDGTVWTWGNNESGELGYPTPGKVPWAYHSSPMQVKGIAHAVAVSAKYNCSNALLADGTVWTWGAKAPGHYLPDRSRWNYT